MTPDPAAPHSLANCRRLFLRDCSVPTRIGVHDFEKAAAQRVVFNIDLWIALADSTPSADDLTEVVDYDFIHRSIFERIGRGHVQLQETLCDDLLATMLAHPKVRAARVSTEKPDVYPDGAVVGCEVFAMKAVP